MKPRNISVGIVILFTLCTAGCQPTPASSDRPAAASPPVSATPPAAPPPAPAAPPAAAPAPSSLASAEGEQPGLRIEIQELKRSDGGTVTLKFAFVNSGGATQWTPIGVGEITLIDAVGKKKYFVAEDSAGACLCSHENFVGLGPGARANLWAKFPAPPEDVQKISVVVPSLSAARRDPDKLMTLLIALLSFAPLQDQPVGQPTFKVLDLVYKIEDLETKVSSLEIKETETEVRIELAADVLFDFDKSNILPKAEQTLTQVAEVVRERGQGSIRIEGHTDSKGADAYNQRLSRQRAESVTAWLRKQPGLATLAYVPEGFGAKRPVAPNTKPDGSDDPQGRQRNRRVEIVLRK